MGISAIKVLTSKSKPSALSLSLSSFLPSTKTKWAGISLPLAVRWTLSPCCALWSVTHSPPFPLDYNGRMVIICMTYGEREWKAHWCNSFKTSSLLYRILGFSKVEIITGRQSQRKREIVETRKEVRRWLEQGQLRHPLEHHLWAWIIQYLHKYTCIIGNHSEPLSKKVLLYFGTLCF